MSSLHAPQAVLFLTQATAPDVPSKGSPWACQLPLAWSSFAERVIDSCVQAGVRHLHMVAATGGSVLREQLGDGTRWGATLQWHQVDELAHLGKLWPHLRQGDPTRVLLGHAHQWVHEQALRRLMAMEGEALAVNMQGTWLGWASLRSHPGSVEPWLGVSDVTSFLQQNTHLARVVVPIDEWAQTGKGAELLATQARALHPQVWAQAPARWIRRPWGLLSPEARVHAQVQIHGPALVGSGCMVMRGAVLGRNVVLTQDVLVGPGARLNEALCLPNTYIAGDVTLNQAVVQGAQVHHAAWRLTQTLTASDAILSPLHASSSGA